MVAGILSMIFHRFAGKIQYRMNLALGAKLQTERSCTIVAFVVGFGFFLFGILFIIDGRDWHLP
jgi:uncharacterized membrane protein YdcZ (DUF606 family)